MSPFVRTREDHARETAEDYVEAIASIVERDGSCRVRDLAEALSVSHVTVVQTLRRLERDGLAVVAARMPVELTAKGRRLAAACRERHEVVLRFLLALGVSEATAEIDSEGMEHHVSRETLERMRAFVERGGA